MSSTPQRPPESHSASVQVETILLDGFVVETILDYAQKNDCDLIVMGSHGRGGFERLLIGSVAEGVLRHSKVPVMIVRFNEAESAASPPAGAEKAAPTS